MTNGIRQQFKVLGPYIFVVTVILLFGLVAVITHPFGSPSAVLPEEEEGELQNLVAFRCVDMATGLPPDEDITDFEPYVYLYSVDISDLEIGEIEDLELDDYTLDTSESDDVDDFELEPENDTFYIFVINSTGWSQRIYRHDDGTVFYTMDFLPVSTNETNIIGMVNMTTDIKSLFHSKDDLNTTVNQTDDRDWKCMWKTNDSNQGFVSEYDLFSNHWSYIVINATFNTTAQTSWISSDSMMEKQSNVNSTIIFINDDFLFSGIIDLRFNLGLGVSFEVISLGFGHGTTQIDTIIMLKTQI